MRKPAHHIVPGAATHHCLPATPSHRHRPSPPLSLIPSFHEPNPLSIQCIVSELSSLLPLFPQMTLYRNKPFIRIPLPKHHPTIVSSTHALPLSLTYRMLSLIISRLSPPQSRIHECCVGGACQRRVVNPMPFRVPVGKMRAKVFCRHVELGPESRLDGIPLEEKAVDNLC